ncbi:hypothetical protein C8R43DRAFT_1012222 [Mycena crocata]|nr:hypothetical protein C8R43DRAFT_1012222 [Mycena crocata]
MSDSPQKRKRPIVVRANAQQIEALQAAFRVDKVFSSEDYEKLSSETGLTSKWIKSWMARVRSRKKEQDRERGLPPSSDLEDLPPPPKKRRTRPAQGPPARATPKLDVGLPPADDAYIPPSKDPSLLPQVSTSIPHNSRSSSFTSAHHKTVRLEPLVSEGSLPWHPTPPISTLMDPKYLQSSFAPPNRIPEPPMLLPPDWAPLSRSTDNAALQLASARGTSTHTPNATAYHPFLPAFAANTSEFHPFAMTPAFSKSIPPATILRASLFSANRPHVSQSAPREYSFKSTPVHALQSHFVSDHYNESSKHMDTFISPSPFVPDIELNDFKPAATPSVGTPVDDRVLFSSVITRIAIFWDIIFTDSAYRCSIWLPIPSG